MAARNKIVVDDIIGIEQKIDQTVAQLTEREKKRKNGSYSKKRDDGETRTRITRWFVVGHLFSVPITLLLLFIYNWVMVALSHAEMALDVEKILPIVTSFIASPVGFVLGYYFKGEDNKAK